MHGRDRGRGRGDELRVNRRIRIREVRLIGPDGSQWGVFATADALKRAEELGLDLVEISPNARPPVCKIMDYGKYKYETNKKKQEAKKKQVVVHIKELKMRPRTDVHDLEVKLKHLRRFLEHGDRVKVSVRFRGREMAYTSMGMEKLHKLAREVSDLSTIEQAPRMDGRMMTMLLAPTKKPKPKGDIKNKEEDAKEENKDAKS